MNKTIIGVIIGVFVLGGLIWLARPKPTGEGGVARPNGQNIVLSVTNSSGALAVEEANNYDFGTVSMAKGIVKHQFKIKNTSGETVTINKIYTSCMCTTAALAVGDRQFGPYGMPGHEAASRIDQAINPNEEAIVEVVFDPAAHGPAGVGRIQRTVTIENNAGQPVELLFAAVVTP